MEILKATIDLNLIRFSNDMITIQSETKKKEAKIFEALDIHNKDIKSGNISTFTYIKILILNHKLLLL